eukprot:m51a1_g872 hypothetical protein (1091) ;mRNA; r:834507-838750
MKVLLFPVFENQRVVQVDEEPLLLAPAGDDAFLVASCSGVVQAFGVGDEAAVPLHAFRLCSPVVLGLLYIPASDSVATVERENAQSRISVVRVYQGWRAAPAEIDSSAAAPDAASSGSPMAVGSVGLQPTPPGSPRVPRVGGSPAGTRPSFELPLHASVTCFGCCPATGRLIVATDTDVSIWAPVEAEQLGLGQAGQLAFEKVLQIDCRGVRFVALHEKHLAFATDSTLRVLECTASSVPKEQPTLQDVLGGGSVDSRDTPFAAAPDEYFVEVEIGPDGKMTSRPGISSIDYATGESAKERPGQSIVYGPVTEVGHPVHVEAHYTMKSLQLLLHVQYNTAVKGPIHTLAFLPEYPYLYPEAAAEALSSSPASSAPKETRPIGMRCLVCTGAEGHLFNVQQPSLLASYTYTSETVTCCASQSFLYALTAAVPESGLEAFTLRTSMGLAEHKAPSPCLMGMQPFMGPKSAVVVGEFVVLLSKLNEQSLKRNRLQSPGRERLPPPSLSKDSMNWSIYMLHPTTLAPLYEDLVKKAQETAKDVENPAVYYQLLIEGHFLLQAKLASLQLQLSGRSGKKLQEDKAAAIAWQMQLKTYHNLLRKSSALLGEHYFHNTREFHNAAQSYSVSDWRLKEVVRLFQMFDDSKPALLEYLDRVLFDPAMMDVMDEDPQLSNEILQYYVNWAPHRLSTVIIDSCLSSYSEKMALLLLGVAPEVGGNEAVAAPRRLSNGGTQAAEADAPPQREIPPKDLFAKALLHLDIGETDAALSVLRSIGCSHVVEFCCANSNILESEQHEGASETATALGLLYLKRIESRLNDAKQMPLSDLLMETRMQDPCFKKWLLLHSQAFTGVPSWVSVLPPFNGKATPLPPNPLKKDEEKILASVDYSFFYLRKLQGLLCSGLIKNSDALLDKLSDMAKTCSEVLSSETLNSWAVLYILCMATSRRYTMPDALAQLVKTYPCSSLDYATQFCTKPEDWKALLETLTLMLTQGQDASSPDTRAVDTPLMMLPIAGDVVKQPKEMIRETYEAVLEHMATNLDPSTFILLLPTNGNMAFFAKYIERACQQSAAAALRNDILKSMRELESTAMQTTHQ